MFNLVLLNMAVEVRPTLPDLGESAAGWAKGRSAAPHTPIPSAGIEGVCRASRAGLVCCCHSSPGAGE